MSACAGVVPIEYYFSPALAQIAPMRSLFPVVYRMGPSWLQEKLAEWVPNAAIREMKHIVDVQERQVSYHAIDPIFLILKGTRCFRLKTSYHKRRRR
jgi:hypothetical protein